MSFPNWRNWPSVAWCATQPPIEGGGTYAQTYRAVRAAGHSEALADKIARAEESSHLADCSIMAALGQRVTRQRYLANRNWIALHYGKEVLPQ